MPERRTRSRRNSLRIDSQEVVKRVKDFYEQDLSDSSQELARRIQRKAKTRMWTEPKDWPWKNSSNIGLPDILQKVLDLTETLVNAVMGQRPAIGAKAHDKSDKDKQEIIDNLIDFQWFEEKA